MVKLEKRGKAGFIRLYSLMYLPVAAIILLYFGVKGKSFVFGMDGMCEHAPALAYAGQWIRDGLTGKGWRMVDFSLGQGLDVLTTLTWFCLTDPAAWVSALFPAEMVETTYAVVIFLRFYLAGVFTALLASAFEADDWQAALAGILYAFSSYTFAASMKHMNFGAGMVLLPLLFYAIERLLREEKWGLYVAVAAVQMIANFYFAYKNTILAILYIVLRLAVELKSGKEVRKCAWDGVKLLFGYLLGIALAAVVFLPMAAAFGNNTRTEMATGYQESLWYYPVDYYLTMFSGMFQSPQGLGMWTIVGAVPLMMFGVMGLYAGKNKRYTILKAMLIAVIVMMCVPAAGKVMNGFGYVTNRFSYALQLLIAIGGCLGLNELKHLKKQTVGAVFAICLLYACGCAFALKYLFSKIVLALFVLTAAVLLVTRSVRCGWMTKKLARSAVCIVAMVSVCVHFVLFFEAEPEEYIENYHDAGSLKYAQVSPMKVFASEDAAEFYRVAGPGGWEVENSGHMGGAAAVMGYRGTSHYWSIIPSEVTDFYTDICLNTEIYTYCVKDLGLDSGLNLLASVKYRLSDLNGNEVEMPGFSPTDEDFAAEEGYEVLENRYSLPIGYTYDDYMTRAEYERLDVMEKRDALLKHAIVDNSAQTLDLTHLGEFSTGMRELDAQIQGVREDDRGVLLDEEFSIVCEVPETAEVWVVFGEHDGDCVAGSGAMMTIRGETGENVGLLLNENGTFAYDQKGQVVPMGVLQPGRVVLDVQLHAAAAEQEGIPCEGIRVYCRAVDEYEASARALGEDVLENVRIGVNRVSGTISLAETKWLQLSIPYSKGWRVRVDGEERELVNCGGMYMGLALTAGEHEIELDYCTPYLKEGAIVSLCAMAIFAVLMVASNRRNRKENV